MFGYRRHLGAAVLPGRYDEAHAYYQKALKVATDMRFRPEIALTRLQFTELLLERYPDEKSEALEHLDLTSKGSTSLTLVVYPATADCHVLSPKFWMVLVCMEI